MDEGTVNYKVYTENDSAVGRKYVNQVFGENWTLQQDGAKVHTHHLSQFFSCNQQKLLDYFFGTNLFTK